MVIRTYFDRNNTLVYNRTVNTGKNPVAELFYYRGLPCNYRVAQENPTIPAGPAITAYGYCFPDGHAVHFWRSRQWFPGVAYFCQRICRDPFATANSSVPGIDGGTGVDR